MRCFIYAALCANSVSVNVRKKLTDWIFHQWLWGAFCCNSVDSVVKRNLLKHSATQSSEKKQKLVSRRCGTVLGWTGVRLMSITRHRRRIRCDKLHVLYTRDTHNRPGGAPVGHQPLPGCHLHSLPINQSTVNCLQQKTKLCCFSRRWSLIFQRIYSRKQRRVIKKPAAYIRTPNFDCFFFWGGGSNTISFTDQE